MVPISTLASAGDYIFLSGIPPMENGNVQFRGDITGQTEYIIRKIETILGEIGLTLANMAYVQVFLKDMDDYQAFNEVYELRMPKPYPARKVITTDFSRDGICIEINGVAYKGNPEKRNVG